MSPLFSGRITISSVFKTGFGFTILSAILFPIHSIVDSTALRSSFLKALFRSSSPVFLVASINYFHICLIDSSRITEIHILWHSFLLWFYEITWHCYLLINNFKLNLSSISNGLSFWSVNIMINSSNLAL